jgi:hypothetical protein
VLKSVWESVNNFDDDAAPTSTNPCVRINSMPIEENKIKIDGSTPGSDFSQDNVNSYNGHVKTFTNDLNTPNLNNNINNPNKLYDSNSLKDSSKSCPDNKITNPYNSNNSGNVGGSKNSQIKGIKNDSGGTQSLSTKSSKNSNELKNSDGK